MYMGGISRDVKGKKSGMFTLYSLGFLDHYIFADLIKITMCLRQLEARYIMSWDS